MTENKPDIEKPADDGGGRANSKRRSGRFNRSFVKKENATSKKQDNEQFSLDGAADSTFIFDVSSTDGDSALQFRRTTEELARFFGSHFKGTGQHVRQALLALKLPMTPEPQLDMETAKAVALLGLQAVKRNAIG